MKYGTMPRLMWTVFRGSFARELPRLTDAPAGPLMGKAHRRYREILAPIPEFERGDRFLVNILSASMLSAVLLELQEWPTVAAVERDSDGLFQDATLYIGEIENRYLTGEKRRRVIHGLYKLPQV